MKKQLLFFLFMLLPLVASADAVEINGIYYNLVSKIQEAEVTTNPNKYTGNVVIPEKVTYENVEYSVTSIGYNAFYDCSGLTSVTIPNSVTSIGEGTFFNCSSLTSVTIPNSVTSIGDYAFRFCSGLTSITIPNSVTSIGNDAFSCCKGLTSVTIPNSVTSIGDLAFFYCSKLTSVTIGSGVTSIGGSAFAHCSGLTSVTIPNSVTSIGGGAFEGCSGLTSVIIPNSVTSIGYGAFDGCTGLTSVTIGSGVTSIGERAFEYCSGLKKVIVKDIAAWCGIKFGISYSNPLYYAKHIYSDEDTEITNLIIPNSVTSIGYYAFQYCSSLTSVTIPNSVTSIGSHAFNVCSGLTSVTIGSGVTSIGEYAFSGCSGLTSVTIGNSVTRIGSYAFRNCSGLTSITIPNSVTSIGYEAFYKCSGLTSITIPNSVTSIGNYAFYGCQELKKISIGNGIQTINSEAFANCPKINDVYCYAVRYPTTKSDAFKNSYPDYITLHVPEESVVQYGAVEPWVHFKKVVALSESDYNEGSEGSGEEGTEKCFKPTISYQNGKLTFNCDTEGAICQYAITDDDIKSGAGNEVQLDVTYRISVYATKSGYQNSEPATATLCWIDQQPQTEGITNGIANVPANAVLIQSEGGSIKVQGVDEGTQVNVYGINGTQAGSAISQSGAATINTNLQPGSIAIVKIGQKSVKVVMK